MAFPIYENKRKIETQSSAISTQSRNAIIWRRDSKLIGREAEHKQQVEGKIKRNRNEDETGGSRKGEQT